MPYLVIQSLSPIHVDMEIKCSFWVRLLLAETLYYRDIALIYIVYVMLISGLHLSLLTGGTAVCGHS